MISRVFPILAVAMFSAMLGVGIIAPLLPLYAEKMGASGIWIGLIFAGFAISQTILMPVFGKLSDLQGRKVLLSVGLFSYAVLSLGYLWAHQVWQLVLVRLVHGAAGGLVIPIAQACVGDLSPQGEEGKWVGYLNAALFAGFGFGPIVGGVLTDAFGINTTFYAMGALNLVAFLLAIMFIPETGSHSGRETSRPRSLRSLLGKPALQALFSFQLTFSMGRGMFFSFLAILGLSIDRLSPSEIGTLLGINVLLMAIYQIFSDRIADRLDKKWLTIVGGIINFVFLALIPVFSTFWQLVLLFVVGAVGGALSIPSVSAMGITEGKKYGMGAVLGALAMGQSLGIATGPIIGGIFADAINISSVFYFAAGIGALGIVLFAMRAVN